MSLVVKTNPVGVDLSIDYFQKYLFNNLGYTDDQYQSYHRVYLNPKFRGDIAEAYIGDGDYKDVLYDDDFSLSSFFLVSDQQNYTDGGRIQTEVSLIVQANLDELFPSITHRPDEELRKQFVRLSEKYSDDSFKLSSITTGVRNVYREIDFTGVMLDDMSDRHVVRFDYEVLYNFYC